MRKRLFLLFTSCWIFMAACGSAEGINTASVQKSAEQAVQDSALEEDIELIFTMASLGEETIEEYVNTLKENNPDVEYLVYDETHYSYFIKESEHKEQMAALPAEIEKTFADFKKEYPYITSYQYDDKCGNITFFINNSEYQDAELFSGLTLIMTTVVISDSVQAYMLIPIEERECNVVFVDDVTKEIIYDTNES